MPPDIDAREAAIFNASASKKLWKQADLPIPWSLGTVNHPEGEGFAWMVAAFQALAGLVVDGKLGTDTLAAMRMHLRGIEAPGDEYVPTTPATAPTLVARVGTSNCLRIGGVSVPLPEAMVAAGISASNFHDDDEHRFVSRKRVHKARYFVMHESVSMSQKATIRTLEAKRKRSINEGKNRGRGWEYGVHLTCAPDGHLSCHADLLTDRLTHATQLNDESIGCEWVNPYNPKWAKPPFTQVIPGPWWCWDPAEAERLYTLPTPPQLYAAVALCRFLPTVLPDLPFAFPTSALGPRMPRIKDWNKRAKPPAGIVAHRDFDDHADGRYLLEHAMDELSRVA